MLFWRAFILCIILFTYSTLTLALLANIIVLAGGIASSGCDDKLISMTGQGMILGTNQ
jgi:hypothetical protein